MDTRTIESNGYLG